jgi:hypothetical protein
MLELTSRAVTSSSGMFSEAKFVSRCGLSSSETLKSSAFRPVTKRPLPSVTTAVIWMTSTSTASAYSTDAVRELATRCSPFLRVATARIRCSFTIPPASHSHE